MRLGIDASNIRSGGGLTHLLHVLRDAVPSAHGFESVIVWAPAATLERLPERSWLLRRHELALESGYVRRALWQYRRLGQLARSEKCHLLFAPGGSFATDFRPVVGMSRNMLPFEPNELSRYGISAIGIRLRLLRWSQRRSFRRANGTIFLTQYARKVVQDVTGPLKGAVSIIPHGVDTEFFHAERSHRRLEACTERHPFKILYVSIIDVYKHQWHVAEAVARLRRAGLPVSLDLVGPAYLPALRRLTRVLREHDPAEQFLHYRGAVRHDALPAFYEAADLCVFASSCENMPNILLEGMASAVPLACSDRGPMPEVLGDAGVYFNPEDPTSIAKALRVLIESAELRLQKAHAALDRARQYSWTRCARETFEFLAHVARGGGVS